MKKALLLALGAVAAIALGVLLYAVFGEDLSTSAPPDLESAETTASERAREPRLSPGPAPRAAASASKPAARDAARPEPEFDENSVDLDARFPVADCMDPPVPTEDGELDPASERALVGRVVDPESLAVAAARVVAIARGNPSERVETTTAIDGTFRLVVGSADDDRDLEVSHEEYGRKTFRVRPSRRGEGGIEVPVGDFVIERAGSISGTVQIAGGGPGSGLEVVLNGPLPGVTPTSELVSPGHQFALRRAKEDGSFAFDRLAPGKYSVEVHPGPERGLAEIEQEIELLSGQELRDVTLLLRPTGQVEILVVDGEGRPVAGLGVSIELLEPTESDDENVAATRRPGAKTAATGTDGRVTFSNASPGRYKARVDSHGARADEGAESEFEISDGAGSVRLTIAVRPSGTISGRVIDGNGDPVRNVGVVATSTSHTEGEAQVRTGITGPNGEFTIAGLHESDYRLEVMDLGAPPESQILATRDGVAAGATDVEIAVSR